MYVCNTTALAAVRLPSAVWPYRSKSVSSETV